MSLDLVNFYDHIKSDDQEIRHYPNESKINISLPARILVLGPSGTGKTNIILNVIKYIGIFDQIVLLAKNLEEPLYKHLIDVYRKLEKKHKIKILLAINDIKDLPSIAEFDPKTNTLLIVDDFICENPKLLAKISEFWIRGRKNGITMTFLSQSYFDTPKQMRKNSNYVIIKKVGNPKDLGRILAEYALGVDKKELEQAYHQALSGGNLTDFFMIDMETKKDELKFRTNFG
jgi:GTPase SAR1 family protein